MPWHENGWGWDWDVGEDVGEYDPRPAPQDYFEQFLPEYGDQVPEGPSAVVEPLDVPLQVSIADVLRGAYYGDYRDEGVPQYRAVSERLRELAAGTGDMSPIQTSTVDFSGVGELFRTGLQAVGAVARLLGGMGEGPGWGSPPVTRPGTPGVWGVGGPMRGPAGPEPTLLGLPLPWVLLGGLAVALLLWGGGRRR